MRCPIEIDHILAEFSGDGKSPNHTLQTLVKLGHALGYDHVIAEYVPAKSSGAQVVSVNNYSERWADESTRVPLDQVLRDPILQHIDTRVDPIVWDERTYASAKLSPLYETYYSNGIGSGIALSLRGANGDLACLGFSNANRVEKSHLQPVRQLGSLFVATAAVFNTLKGVAKPMIESDAKRPALTPREIECLRWARAGKTSWETSVILGISQATATFHLKNAIAKLDASNKTHAVVCAVQLGYIQ